jgi:hypothetical protein
MVRTIVSFTSGGIISSLTFHWVFGSKLETFSPADSTFLACLFIAQKLDNLKL